MSGTSIIAQIFVPLKIYLKMLVFGGKKSADDNKITQHAKSKTIVSWFMKYRFISNFQITSILLASKKTAIENTCKLLHCWVFLILLLSSGDFFSKLTFPKNSFRNTIKDLDSLNPDQDRRSVGPDLGPN